MSKMILKIFIALIFLITVPELSFGQSEDSASVPTLAPESGWEIPSNTGEINFLSVFGKAIGALMLIMLMIYGVVWLLRLFMNKRTLGNLTASSIRVISTTYIAPKKSVALLQVYDKAVLIGISENSMDALIELDEESGWKDLISESMVNSNNDKSFAQKLSNALKENLSKNMLNKGNKK